MSNDAILFILVALMSAAGFLHSPWWFVGVAVIAVPAVIGIFVGKSEPRGEKNTHKEGSYHAPSEPDPRIQPNELMPHTLHSNGWTWDRNVRAWRNDKTGEYGYYER